MIITIYINLKGCLDLTEAVTLKNVNVSFDFSSKQEAIEWIESMMEEVQKGKRGKFPSFGLFTFRKCTERHGKFPAIAKDSG